LKNILDRHLDIAVVTEFQFFKLIYSKRHKYSDFSKKQTREFTATQMAKILTKTEYPNNESDLNREQLEDEFRKAEDYCDLFYRASRAVASKERYDVLVHNTPSDGFFLPVLFDLFPDAKVVHVVRDGREVVASAAKRGWGYHPFDQISQWQETLRLYDTFSQQHPEKSTQMQEYKYEDIVNNSRQTLSDIISFIGLGEAPEGFYDFSDFAYSNSSFGTDKEGLYHSENFDDFFSPTQQKKITTLLKDDLQEREYGVGETGFYPFLWLWNLYRRLKFRLFVWAKQAGYSHYYNKVRRLLER